MLKHEIRKLYLQRRLEKKEERLVLDFKIHSQFDRFLPPQIKTLHVYLPIESKGEIDTWPIIHRLWVKNIQVVVPVMDIKKNLLKTYLLERETQIRFNDWGIPEPAQGLEIDNELVEAVVVPLLAFDIKGYRVGYGKGFYDTFLSSLNKNVLKIGLSYFPPVDKISNPDPWDIPLNACITPDSIIKF